jgi:membrane-bound lytic murein transglycosylase D
MAMWPGTRALAHCVKLGVAVSVLGLLQACASMDSNRSTDAGASAVIAADPKSATTSATSPDQAAAGESAAIAEESDIADEATTGTSQHDRPDSVSAPLDIWQKFSALNEDLQCDRLSTRSARWLSHYVHQRAGFEAELQRALPLILLVASELERRSLPLQFAMLPMVESQYGAPRSSGNRPAGLWQLMPRTARGFGVVIRDDYDGRLDFLRATEAAADLLLHLSAQFHGDWRLVNVAFNAGEFRVKRSLRGSQTPDLIEHLGLSKITLHHLAKVEALACLIANASAHGINLPVPQTQPPLVAVPLPLPIATGFLAHLAGVDLATLRRWNPALHGEFTPDRHAVRVILPAPEAGQLHAALQNLPAETWQTWGLIAIKSVSERQRLLELYAGQLATIREVNGAAVDKLPTRLWLPIGRAPKPERALAASEVSANGVHVIRSGDTLWGIARRYGLTLKSLMDWNRLNGSSVLRLGQSIRLRPP